MEKINLKNSSSAVPTPTLTPNQNQDPVSSGSSSKTKIKKYFIVVGLILIIAIVAVLSFKYLKESRSTSFSTNSPTNSTNSSASTNLAPANSSPVISAGQVAVPPARPPKLCSVASSSSVSEAVLLVVFDQALEKEMNNLINIFSKNNLAIDSISDTKNVINMFRTNDNSNDCNQIEPTVNSDVVDINKYKAVIFSGGPNVLSQIDNPKWHKLAEDFYRANKIVAADLSGVGILAKAGLLQDKNITIPFGQKDKLEGSGAIYQETSPVVDGQIITGSDINTVDKFAEAIVSAIK